MSQKDDSFLLLLMSGQSNKRSSLRRLIRLEEDASRVLYTLHQVDVVHVEDKLLVAALAPD